MQENSRAQRRAALSCIAVALLSACGGGSSGGSTNPGSVTTYTVSTTGGTGGTISPSSMMVDAGGTTTLSVTSNSGYVISGVTGCGGTLSGNTYTTGAINANCTVMASFAAVFTWVSGPNTTNGMGSYGTRGVAATTNVPGARDNGVTWTDASGNLWLFGGIGLDASGTNGSLNDLWEYSPSGGQWTWISGSSTVNAQGEYGTRGIAAATNVPGARRSATGWTDASGNLWLFGGAGYDSTGAGGVLNDLWEYSPSSGEWTWVGGSSTVDAPGVYGTQGVAAPGNVPGARNSPVTWTDAGGNVWLFGGAGYVPSMAVLLNDLWEYSPSSGEWTWVSGSSTPSASGTYGSQGVAAATNMPGARENEVAWLDGSGNLWLFGGYGFGSTRETAELNDLWKYSASSGEWTWVSGSSDVNPTTWAYGTEGVAASTNMPPPRQSAMGWTDVSGNLWLFGGLWSVPGTFGDLNDLWEYSPSSGQWTWVSGSGSGTIDAKGVYGVEGVTAGTNVPGARYSAVTWMNAGGKVWLFGGYGFDAMYYGYLNDLWEYPVR